MSPVSKIKTENFIFQCPCDLEIMLHYQNCHKKWQSTTEIIIMYSLKYQVSTCWPVEEPTFKPQLGGTMVSWPDQHGTVQRLMHRFHVNSLSLFFCFFVQINCLTFFPSKDNISVFPMLSPVTTVFLEAFTSTQQYQKLKQSWSNSFTTHLNTNVTCSMLTKF